MKSYEERIPEIDKAIDHYKGKLPRKGNPNSSIVVYAFGRYYFITDECFEKHRKDVEFVCYEEEFEQRAKELGWVNGYKWGVEYETNGEKPVLPDDVTVSNRAGMFSGVTDVETVNWERVKSFSIIDSRYKPKEQEMNNGWYEKGELPPVGEECEYIVGERKGYLRCTFVGLNSRGSIVIETVDGEYLTYHDYQIKFRPLQSEHDRLVNQARTFSYSMDVFHEPTARVMIEAGWRPTKEEK